MMRSIFLIFLFLISFTALSKSKRNCIVGLNSKYVCPVDNWEKIYSSSDSVFNSAVWKNVKNNVEVSFVAGRVQEKFAKSLTGLVRLAKILFTEKDFKFTEKFSNPNFYIATVSSKRSDHIFYQGYLKNYKNQFINVNCMVKKGTSPWEICRKMFEEIGQVKI